MNDTIIKTIRTIEQEITLKWKKKKLIISSNPSALCVWVYEKYIQLPQN